MTRDIAIIDSGGANFTSIQAALDRLQVKSIVTSDPAIIVKANKVILPGVGAAAHAMDLIHKKGLYDVIRSLNQPVLGVCLGQQILCTSSEEGGVECLGIIPIRVKKLQDVRIIPHMGWNNLIYIKEDEPLLEGINTQDSFYFVHSFAPEVDENYTLATCKYDVEFSAIIKKDNFYGAQFHPEKSGAVGERLLKNFITITN
jgi:glutamine amidotransferase